MAPRKITPRQAKKGKGKSTDPRENTIHGRRSKKMSAGIIKPRKKKK